MEWAIQQFLGSHLRDPNGAVMSNNAMFLMQMGALVLFLLLLAVLAIAVGYGGG
jgi:hypothetical protein